MFRTSRNFILQTPLTTFRETRNILLTALLHGARESRMKANEIDAGTLGQAVSVLKQADFLLMTMGRESTGKQVEHCAYECLRLACAIEAALRRAPLDISRPPPEPKASEQPIEPRGDLTTTGMPLHPGH